MSRGNGRSQDGRGKKPLLDEGGERSMTEGDAEVEGGDGNSGSAGMAGCTKAQMAAGGRIGGGVGGWLEMEMEVEVRAARGRVAAAAWGRRRRGEATEKNCGRGKEWWRSSQRRRHEGVRRRRRDGSWTPSPAFLEQPLERESTPFFLQMTARVCGGSIPLL